MLKPYFERKPDVESFGNTTTEPEETKTIRARVGIAGNHAESNSKVMNLTATTINPVLMRKSC